MRACVSASFKTIGALVALALIVSATMAARSDPPSLAARLEQHARAVASEDHNTSKLQALDDAARYIEAALTAAGFRVHRQEYLAGGHKVRNLEVALINTRNGKRPDRIFIVGAHYDLTPGAPGANDNGSGTAAVIELARLLKGTRLSEGTELKFVFFINEEPPWFMGEAMGSWQHANDLRDREQPVEGAPSLEKSGITLMRRVVSATRRGLKNAIRRPATLSPLLARLRRRSWCARRLPPSRPRQPFRPKRSQPLPTWKA